jgi:hypothetical protein
MWSWVLYATLFHVNYFSRVVYRTSHKISSWPEHFRVQLYLNWFYLLLIICLLQLSIATVLKGLFSRESVICLVYSNCFPNFSLHHTSTFSTFSTLIHLFPFCQTPSTGPIWKLTLTSILTIVTAQLNLNMSWSLT